MVSYREDDYEAVCQIVKEGSKQKIATDICEFFKDKKIANKFLLK